MTPKIFSFFSGAGFLDLGFEQAGFETIFANEIHPEFMKTYNFARQKLSIKEPKLGCFVNSIESFFTDKEIREQFNKIFQKATHKKQPIGFIGGPPCPDFSVAGKNKGREGNNGRLSGLYTKLICQYKPDFFIFENVKGLWRTKRHREYYEELKQEFTANDYLLIDNLINALEYGVPQDRDRIILFGILKTKTNTQNLSKHFNWKKFQIYSKEQINSINFPKTTSFNEQSILKMPNEILSDITIEYWFQQNDVTNHPNANHFFKPREGLSKFLIVEEGDCSKKSYKRPHRWRYSPTASYGNNEVHLHPYRARRMSISETLAIQSLPREYQMPKDISLSNMFKMVGNGVPYLAALGIGKTVKDFLENHYETHML